jgi:electron transfer flavoprotein alpha subunit
MILIVAEYANNKLSKSTAEMVTAARNSGVDGPVTILVLGIGIAAIAAEAARLADQVLVVDSPKLQRYNAETWAAAITFVAQEGEAKLILIGGSRSGREYSPRVAVQLDAPLLEDIIALKNENGTMRAQRYAYLARVTETVEASAPAIIATIKPGIFSAAQPSNNSEQFDVEVDLPESRIQITGKTTAATGRIALAEADIVVSGGRGTGSPEGFTALVEGLADKLGAAVGATRAVVDAGWRPYAEQVGQTGKTVQPKLYIAVGISGAVQHLSGMNKAKTIVAFNRDADAPIFQIADYGIVGDVAQVVPALIAQLK